MVTFPIDLALSAAVGSTVALAGRSTANDYPLLRSPALWSLVAFELLVFVPVGAYFLWRFPGWSLMYLVDPESLPMPAAYLAIFYPTVALGVFVACRRLLALRKLLAVLGILGGSALLAAVVWLFGQEQLSVVGSTVEFRTDPAGMREVFGSSLSWVGAAGAVVVAISWVVTLWRLMLLARVGRRAAAATVTAESIPTDDEEPPKSKSKTGKRRKKKAS